MLQAQQQSLKQQLAIGHFEQIWFARPNLLYNSNGEATDSL